MNKYVWFRRFSFITLDFPSVFKYFKINFVMNDFLTTVSTTELAALKQCADVICEKYKNLYEASRGNEYGDTEVSKETQKEFLKKLNLAESKKNLIIDEIENRLGNV